MKTRILLLLLISMVFNALGASPAPTPRSIPLSSPVYTYMDILYRIEGLPLASSSRPWSGWEASTLYSRIADTQTHRQLRSALSRQLEKESPVFAADRMRYRISSTFNLEGYAHTNPTFSTSHDWIRSLDQREPFARFFVEAARGEHFYFSTSIDVGVSPVMRHDDKTESLSIGAFDSNVDVHQDAVRFSSYVLTNFPFPMPDLPIGDWPHDSQLSLGTQWWSLSIGRGRLKWGNGVSGDLVIGDHISNHQHLSFSIFGDTSKLHLLYIFLPNPLEESVQRIFLAHRFEFECFKKARISISENVMYKGPEPIIRYMDPTYVYHNIYDRTHLNSIASIELDWAILPSISMHGQFVLDQYQLPTESDYEANAMGYLVNLSYSWQQRPGYWTATIEYGYTDPVLYRRDGVDFLVARGLSNNHGATRIDFLGYSWGSDGQVLQATGSYLLPNILQVTGSITFHRQGELTFKAPHHKGDGAGDPDSNAGAPNVNGPAPSGDNHTERVICSLSFRWETPLPSLAVHGQVDWITRWTYHKPSHTRSASNVDFQFTLGLSYSF